MKKANKHNIKYFGRIKSLPFISENSFSVNLLLLLSVFAFVIITVDLQTELAKENGEVENLVAVLSQTINNPDLTPIILSEIIPQAEENLPPVPFITADNNITSAINDRAPPTVIS